MKKLLLLITLLACQIIRLGAQTTPPPDQAILPPGPLIQKRAPEFARWTIFSKTAAKTSDSKDKPSTSEKTDASPNGSPKFSITKTGKIIRVIFFEDEKLPWNIWCKDGTVIAVWPDGKNLGFASRPTRPDAFNPLYLDFANSDFQGFEWLSAKNYTGIREVFGRKCLVFKDRIKQTPEGMRSDDPDAASMTYESSPVASVDLETRLPVSLVNETGAVIYQFHDAPTEMQTLPANVQGLIDQQKQAVQSVARRPSKPF
jgi:hypothetical protein